MVGLYVYGFFLLRGLYDTLIGNENEIPELPEDIIIFNILTFLPVKKVHELRCVCKSWLNKIESSSFAHIHMSRLGQGLLRFNEGDYTWFSKNSLKRVRWKNIMVRCFTHQRSYIWSSCNGLLLCRDDDIFVLNPFTKILVRLPPPVDRSERRTTQFICGRFISTMKPDHHLFGMTYMVSSGKYKVIHVFSIRGSKETFGCEILTLGEHTWKVVHLSLTSTFHGLTLARITFLENMAHWVVTETREQEENSRGFQNFVVSFDLVRETLYKTEFPCDIPGHDCLFDLGGVLSFATRVHGHSHEFEIWSLKDLWSGKWVKQETIVLEGIRTNVYALTALGKDGIIVFISGDQPLRYYAYDLQLRRTQYLDLDMHSKVLRTDVLPHTDSLAQCPDTWADLERPRVSKRLLSNSLLCHQ